MKLLDKLYVGDLVDDLPFVFNRLKEKKSVFGLYCICISPVNKFFAEILSSRELFSDKNKEKEYILICIAKGKPEAKEVFSKIIEDFVSSENSDLTPSKFKEHFASEDFICV